MRSSQVFRDGGRYRAIQLHFALAIQKPAKRLIELTLEFGNLLFDSAKTPFDITFNLVP